jgi:hypothetical protein
MFARAMGENLLCCRRTVYTLRAVGWLQLPARPKSDESRLHATLSACTEQPYHFHLMFHIDSTSSPLSAHIQAGLLAWERGQ